MGDEVVKEQGSGKKKLDSISDFKNYKEWVKDKEVVKEKGGKAKNVDNPEEKILPKKRGAATRPRGATPTKASL